MLIDYKILKETNNITESIYNNVVRKIGYSAAEIRLQVLDGKITIEEYERKFEELDEVYRASLCSLPTSVLNNIITADKTGQQKRAQKTIDTIATELLERELEESK